MMMTAERKITKKKVPKSKKRRERDGKKWDWVCDDGKANDTPMGSLSRGLFSPSPSFALREITILQAPFATASVRGSRAPPLFSIPHLLPRPLKAQPMGGRRDGERGGASRAAPFFPFFFSSFAPPAATRKSVKLLPS